EHVGDALVEPADQRADDHHDRDADGDTQDRESGAHLVGAQRRESDADAFEQGGHGYSWRSAAMGSSRAARLAGDRPAITPTLERKSTRLNSSHDQISYAV